LPDTASTPGGFVIRWRIPMSIRNGDALDVEGWVDASVVVDIPIGDRSCEHCRFRMVLASEDVPDWPDECAIFRDALFPWTRCTKCTEAIKRNLPPGIEMDE
jgi:hypothetical protein